LTVPHFAEVISTKGEGVLPNLISRRLFLGVSSAFGVTAAIAKKGFCAMSKEELPAADLGFLPSKLPLKKRAAWTKQVPKPWILKPSKDFDRITVHHSAGPVNVSKTDVEVVANIEAVCLEHITRGYGDIGYHFVIDVRGIAWEARSLSYVGAHVSGQNDGNIGIMLLGNYEEQTVTEKQKKALAILIESLRDKYQVKRHRLFGHRDLGKSLCPGKHLYKYVEVLKKP
jgi:hypothetical protein